MTDSGRALTVRLTGPLRANLERWSISTACWPRQGRRARCRNGSCLSWRFYWSCRGVPGPGRRADGQGGQDGKVQPFDLFGNKQENLKTTTRSGTW